MKIILGNTPEKDGMYVVYEDTYLRFPKKVFLTYLDSKWSYPSSDQKFRGVIIGYIGPMPSPKTSELVGEPDVKYAISQMPEGLHGCFKQGPRTLLKDMEDEVGDEGDYIFKLESLPDGESTSKPVRKWSDKKIAWLKRKKNE